jgi:hypothetical protein
MAVYSKPPVKMTSRLFIAGGSSSVFRRYYFRDLASGVSIVYPLAGGVSIGTTAEKSWGSVVHFV